MEPDLVTKHGEDVGVDLVRQFLMRNGGMQYKIRVLPERKGSGFQEVSRWLHDRFGAGDMDIALGPLNHDTCLSWSILTRLREGRTSGEIRREFHCHQNSIKRHRRNFLARGLLPLSTTTKQETPQ